MVESSYQADAVNQAEDAVGILQIRPIMVREVNRILDMQGSPERFIYSDRLSQRQSYRMCNIFLVHQMKMYRKKYSTEPDWMTLAGSWNTGDIFTTAPEEYLNKLMLHKDVMKLPEVD
jgi:hypothetical protein